MLKRCARLGAILGLLIAALVNTAQADRYQNVSGLSAGRFVWSPTTSPEGALAIVVSPRAGTLHVYRNGIEIGISTIKVADADAVEPAVFQVTAIDGRVATGSDAGASTLVWRGMELFAGGNGLNGVTDLGIRLPRDFAELLMKATQKGALVVVAKERSGPQVFSAPGPFADPIETGGITPPNRVARFAQPELAPQPGRAGDMERRPTAKSATTTETGVRGDTTSIILSRADLSAYVMQNGRQIDRMPIAVDDPTRPFGLHAAVLLSPGRQDREARWFAIGMDDDADAAHVVADLGARALRRVRFMDRGSSSALAKSLKAGTVFILMDGHGPSATEAPGFDIALLASADLGLPAKSGGETQPLADSSTPSAAADKKVETRQAPPVRSVSAERKSPTRQRGRMPRKGPLDEREAWPNSIYWPY